MKAFYASIFSSVVFLLPLHAALSPDGWTEVYSSQNLSPASQHASPQYEKEIRDLIYSRAYRRVIEAIYHAPQDGLFFSKSAKAEVRIIVNRKGELQKIYFSEKSSKDKAFRKFILESIMNDKIPPAPWQLEGEAFKCDLSITLAE